MQDGLLQLGYRVVEAPRHQEAFEPSPHPLYRVQVRAVRRQALQPQPPLLPPRLTLSNRPGSVKRRVVQDNHTRLALSLRLLGQSVQVTLNLCTAARTLDHRVFQPLGFPFQAQRADEVDPSGRPPSAPHPVLVGLALRRPGVARRQAQTEAALVQVLQDDLPFLSPFLRASSSSRASRSSSGSGGLLGT
jgi:hypothetical protein